MAYNSRPGIVQLKFVDADVGAALYPFVTPQTIILDNHWSVKLTKLGVFNENSLAGAIALLNNFAEPQPSP